MNLAPRYFAHTQYKNDPPFDKTQLQFGDIVMTHHPRVQLPRRFRIKIFIRAAI